MKAEAHRLGYEMSEDALSWNVFVSLAEADKLRDAVKFLTGLAPRKSPDLYLWGRRINDPDGVHKIYEPLARVRAELEPRSEVRAFPTEPDIMLVAEAELVVCIEAKFGSRNTRSDTKPQDEGKKPTSRRDLLARYLGDRTSDRTKRMICREKIGATLYSQLFRNIVFAAEMAGTTPWHVVNLVQRGSSCPDPTDEIRNYLHADFRDCFTFRTWEGLHEKSISAAPELGQLDAYLRGKSAHFRRAFALV
jgi:hypothetical protein